MIALSSGDTNKQEMAMSNASEVAVIEVTPELAPTLYASGGLKGLFEQVKQAASGEVPDLSTKKGRDRVASLAAQVSRSKTAVEKPGREYLKRIKELPKEVEAELREWVRGCDELRDQVREPLTVIENQYKERISDISSLGDAGLADGVSSEMAAEYLDKIESIDVSDMWPEWQKDAQAALTTAKAKAVSSLARILNAEQVAAEMARIEALAARLEQEARDRRIAEEAADKARKKEEARQLAARQETERRELESRRLAQEAVEREEKAKKDAEQAEIARQQAEARRIADAEQAELNRIQAEAQAKINAEAAARAAAESERKRIADEQKARDAEEARRMADREHMGRINRSIHASMVAIGVEPDKAKDLIKAIAKGEIENLSIKY